jgi:hypothetical protein
MSCALYCWLSVSVGFAAGTFWCALMRDRVREEATVLTEGEAKPPAEPVGSKPDVAAETK